MIRLAALFLLFPLAAVAQQVSIRSGEHPTFSRLVLSIGDGTDWEITSNETGFDLELNGQTDGFDTTNVFDRIPRDRLADVSEITPNTLRLTTDCPCTFDAFIWRPGELVVDIVDGGLPRVEGEVVSVDATGDVFDEQLSEPGSVLPNMLILTPQHSAVLGPRAQVTPIPAAEIDVSVTEAAIAEGIARAASQGFLSPNLPPTPEESSAVSTDIVARAPDDVSVEPLVPARPGVGISTALDRELAQLGAVIGETIEPQCLPDDVFQIGEWGDDRDFHIQVAALANDLAGEFGEQPVEAQDRLARLYIHFGFGAEARAALALNPASSQSRILLDELAGLVDDYEGNYPLIRSQSGCQTTGALWAFLVQPSALDAQSRNRMTRQFLSFPQPLRNQLTPRMARHFLDAGFPDAADQLLRATQNSDAETNHDVQSVRALVAESQDDPARALAVLSQEAENNARTTPQSLMRLIALDLEQGVAPREEDLLLLAAMRHENRGMPVELEITLAEATGRTAIGQYQIALEVLTGNEDPAAWAVIDQIYADISSDAEPGTFLGFAYGALPTALTPETENVMAKRLIELGFPERALSIMRGSAEREAAAERRYLRAEAANGIGNHFEAVEELLGMSDERARTLRAIAFEGIGKHRDALAALTADQAASSPTLQFRANAWERLTVDEDEVLAAFAVVVLEPANLGGVETLADRREILTQSQESRRAIDDLLLRFDGTSPTEEWE